VRRPTGPWSPAVHEYLRHLSSAGFEGSPRVLATGDGWEELTYIEGTVAFDPDWQPGRGNRLPPQARTDRALAGAGRLLRALHAAAAGFEPAVTTYRFHPLAPPAQLAQAGFDPVPDLPERLRLFVDAYGLADRARIVPALLRSPLASAERVRYAPVDAAGAAASLEFLAGELRWIHGISADLARAL
jgi:hypothetical protein